MRTESITFIRPLEPLDNKINNRRDRAAFIGILLFLFLNTIKITLFNVFIINPISAGMLIYKFVFTLVFDAAVFLFIFKARPRYLFFVFYVIQLIYLFANLAYYIYFHNYLHILLSPVLITESVNAVSHFSIPKDPKLLTVFIDVPAFIYLISVYRRVMSLKQVFKVARRVSLVACIAIVILAEGWGGINNQPTYKLIKNYTQGGEAKIVHRYGTLFNSVADVLMNSGDKNAINRLEYASTTVSNAGRSGKANIVVIQVESMDANVINQKYKDKYIAPFLHSLSEQSIYYPYVLSYHRAGGTSDTEFSIINSVEPLDDFPAMKLKNYNFPNSIINKLKEKSYTTIAFHGNVGSFFNRDVAFPKMGFDEYFDIDKMQLKNEGWGAPDNKVFDFASNYMKTEKEPFINYIITMTSHAPFNNVDNYYHNQDYDDIEDSLVRGYYNSISYVDQSIKDFVTYVKQNHKNTYIFIWGDHTPSIETDIYRQASFILDDKYFEFVPLIVITPDNKVFREDEMVAAFLDIGPTILNASGINFSVKSDGENLLDGQISGKRIPFKGSDYDRKDLYRRIVEQVQK